MASEKFSIPAVGGIIIKHEEGEEYILIQDRYKPEAEIENGLIEIPSGKIRENENIFDCLRREVKEETGYTIQSIAGEQEATKISINGYTVLNYVPFSSSQNLSGHYSAMVQVFLCKIIEDDNTHLSSDESKNIRWIKKSDLKQMLNDNNKFYPMHVTTLIKYCKE